MNTVIVEANSQRAMPIKTVSSVKFVLQSDQCQVNACIVTFSFEIIIHKVQGRLYVQNFQARHSFSGSSFRRLQLLDKCVMNIHAACDANFSSNVLRQYLASFTTEKYHFKLLSGYQSSFCSIRQFQNFVRRSTRSFFHNLSPLTKSDSS